jgi:hypothetical protein
MSEHAVLGQQLSGETAEYDERPLHKIAGICYQTYSDIRCASAVENLTIVLLF